MYEVILTKAATKALRKIPRNLTQRIYEKLRQIAEDPYAKHNNVTKLRDEPGYRLRVGDWRVIYEIKDDQLVILVLRIAPRGGVYR